MCVCGDLPCDLLKTEQAVCPMAKTLEQRKTARNAENSTYRQNNRDRERERHRTYRLARKSEGGSSYVRPSRSSQAEVTLAYAKEHLSYCPLTGYLFRTGSSSSEKARACRLLKGGYLRVSLGGSTYGAHRVVWLLNYGCWPKTILDHANGVKTDNRLENLRIASVAENTWNQKLRATNTSGYKNVSWDKRAKAWIVQLDYKGAHLKLGHFDHIEDAVEVATKARKDLHVEFARHE